jgi:hypothetical protein
VADFDPLVIATSRRNELSLVPLCILLVLVCTVVIKCHIYKLLKPILEFILPTYLLTCNTNILVVALLAFEFEPSLTLLPVDNLLYLVLRIERKAIVLIIELKNIVVMSVHVVEGRGLNVSTLRLLEP